LGQESQWGYCIVASCCTLPSITILLQSRTRNWVGYGRHGTVTTTYVRIWGGYVCITATTKTKAAVSPITKKS
jgi:hypothetical protein